MRRSNLIRKEKQLMLMTHVSDATLRARVYVRTILGRTDRRLSIAIVGFVLFLPGLRFYHRCFYNCTVLLWVKNILNSYFFNITMDDKMVFWGMSNFFDALPSQLLKSDPLLELAIQA
jgi:hypothetical protein